MLGDPYQLQHAADCLLDNAIKFTPAGGRVGIQVCADRPDQTEPAWICFSVTDTGIGIAREEQDRIFASFYQADGSTTRRYGGLGLGLTVAKAVVEAHAGDIKVSSQPGEGSRLTIRIPTLQPDDQAGQLPPAVRRILVVDDEEMVAMIIQEGLESLPNCQVVMATSGEQALQLFAQQPFDLVITDYKMPGVSGLTLAARIRQLYPQTVIIMITAYGDDILRDLAAQVSILRILDKPVKLKEIRDTTLEALEQLNLNNRTKP